MIESPMIWMARQTQAIDMSMTNTTQKNVFNLKETEKMRFIRVQTINHCPTEIISCTGHWCGCNTHEFSIVLFRFGICMRRLSAGDIKHNESGKSGPNEKCILNEKSCLLRALYWTKLKKKLRTPCVWPTNMCGQTQKFV